MRRLFLLLLISTMTATAHAQESIDCTGCDSARDFLLFGSSHLFADQGWAGTLAESNIWVENPNTNVRFLVEMDPVWVEVSVFFWSFTIPADDKVAVTATRDDLGEQLSLEIDTIILACIDKGTDVGSSAAETPGEMTPDELDVLPGFYPPAPWEETWDPYGNWTLYWDDHWFIGELFGWDDPLPTPLINIYEIR